jgi:lactoylglutathione lyase
VVRWKRERIGGFYMDDLPNVKQAVPFFGVANLEGSLRFYVDGLGFKMTRQWRVDGQLRWCWLEIGNAAIMLQQFPSEGHDAWAPQGKVGDGVTICFQCTDALAIYHAAVSRGLNASRPFVGNGMWVTSLSDPDGYRIDFESVTDTPEETQYSEGA